MGKTVIPEQVTYHCDRCDQEVPDGQFKAFIRVNKKDLGAGTVDDIQTYELGQTCMTELATWWRSYTP